MADLDELLSDSAVENLRLEFKREVPSKDELLKKLSSFANTYGGYLIVGAEANSSDGRLVGLPGVERQANYKQTIVQHCQAGVLPPLQPQVSDPIPISTDPERVCYVILVGESFESPHFLNSRKGVYIRTDEFSTRFEPKFAKLDEIEHLLNRREKASATRSALRQRAESRFATLVSSQYGLTSRTQGGSGAIGATLGIFAGPMFPVGELLSHQSLLQLMRDGGIGWRSSGFPSVSNVITQLAAVVALQPTLNFSIFELGTSGHCYFAHEIEHVTRSQGSGININSLVGHLLVYARYLDKLVSKANYSGMLTIQLRLERVRGVRWLYFSSGFPQQGPSSVLDDDIDIGASISAVDLVAKADALVSGLLRSILFALNWPNAATNDESIKGFLRAGYTYNLWQEPQQ